MAFNTTTLEAAIKNALDNQSDVEVKPADARAQMAKEIADAIKEFVSTVQVSSNIPVSTTGSATAQTGFTTAKGVLE